MKCDLQEINFYPPSVHLLSSLICLGEMTPLVTIWIFGGGKKKKKVPWSWVRLMLAAYVTGAVLKVSMINKEINSERTQMS